MRHESKKPRTGQRGANNKNLSMASNTRTKSRKQGKPSSLSASLTRHCEQKGVFRNLNVARARFAWWRDTLTTLPERQRKEALLEAHTLGLINEEQTQELYSFFQMAGV